MFKKFIYAASFCAIAMLASCGNNNNTEAATDAEAPANEEVVGVEVQEVQTPDGTAEVAQEEVVAPATTAEGAEASAPAETPAAEAPATK